MKPLDTSSGDPLADRRADYAEMLFADGEHRAAAGLMADALELAPGWALGWFRLGEFHEAAGDSAAAVTAWRMAQRLDPDDRAGAALKLSLAGDAPTPARPPSAFVETLFDQYAERFDASLVDKLGYRVPELLDDAIRRARLRPATSTPNLSPQGGEGQLQGRGFKLARDLGCGTGLMGERLHRHVARLEGFDISAAMLAKARAKGVYDHLGKADLQAPPPELFEPLADLVTAADVFMYVGALDAVFAATAKMLEPGGLFAFSVEAHDGPDDFALGESRRYAHAQAYVLRLLDGNGFALVSLDAATIRMDRNAPVQGLIIIAQRR